MLFSAKVGTKTWIGSPRRRKAKNNNMLCNKAIEDFGRWKLYRSQETTVKGYLQILNQFCIFVRNKEIEDIVLQDVLLWYELHSTTGYNQNTLISKGIALRKFFEFWLKKGLKVIDPWLIPVPSKDHNMPRVASREKYERLLETIPHNNDPRNIRNRAILMMLWDTGVRIGELLSLNMGDIERNKAIIKTEKNRGSRPFRQIFWKDDTQEALDDWFLKRGYLEKKMSFQDLDAVFISIASSNHPTSGRRFTIKGAGEMLRRYSNRAGLPYVNAHSFRHAFGHRIVKNGGSASDVANLLGHASLQSSIVYTNMYGDELKERYDFINGKEEEKVAKKVIHRGAISQC